MRNATARLLLGLALLLPAQAGEAASFVCHPPQDEAEVRRIVARSDAVWIGVVVHAKPVGVGALWTTEWRAVVRIERVLKGDRKELAPIWLVGAYAPSEVPERYVFYLTERPGEGLASEVCSGTRRTSEARLDLQVLGVAPPAPAPAAP